MDNLINELTDVLEKEAALYNELLSISRRKTPVLVEGKVAELENITKEEQSLVLQLSELENRREKLMEEVSGKMSIKPENLTVTELVKHVGNRQGERLDKVRKHILDVIEELRSTNQLNAELVRNSLDFINFSLNLITSFEGEGNTYNGGAKKSGSKAKSLFDLKI